MLKESSKSGIKQVDLDKELDPYQLEAVKTLGNVLVIAGPGSGKTRVLTYRIYHLIANLGVPASDILALTFTRKAAEEMKSRIRLLTGQDIRAFTFHSFCFSEIKENPALFEISKEVGILDEEDVIDLLNTIITDEHSSALAIVADSKVNRFVAKVLSTKKNNLMTIEDVVRSLPNAKFINDESVIQNIIRVLNHIEEEYEHKKFRLNRIDYDDILFIYYNTIKTQEAERYLQKLCSNLYLLIDEYQDTNILQLEIVKILGRYNNQVFAVGDDLQSIYMFRGANYKVMKLFQQELCKSDTYLTVYSNYRSKANIVDFVNEFTKNMQTKLYDKKLLSSRSDYGILQKIYVDDADMEAKKIVDIIKRKLNEGYEPGDIAILYRSDFMSNILELRLNEHRIDYVKFGGRKFIERAHVKDVFALLLLIINHYDTLAISRVLNKVLRIENKEKIKDVIEKIGFQQIEITDHENFPKEFHERVQPRVHHLCKFLYDIDKENEKETLRANEIVRRSLNFIKNYSIHLADKSKHKRVIDDWRLLERISLQYRTLTSFVQSFYVDEDVNSEDEDRKDKVVLSTIHSVKGKEYRVVMLAHAGYTSKQSVNNIEEEERVYYVAITRAKDELYIIEPEFAGSWVKVIEFPHVADEISYVRGKKGKRKETEHE